MNKMRWKLGIGCAGLFLLSLSAPARADIPPADACMTVGEACSNTDNGDPGVCKASTCVHPTPGGSMTYECYRCLPEGGGAGGASGAGGADNGDAGGSTETSAGAPAETSGGASSSGGKSSTGGKSSSGGTNSVAGTSSSTGGSPTSGSKDKGGCSFGGTPRKGGALALWFGMSIFGLALRRQRRAR